MDKKSVEDWINEVNYGDDPFYIPSSFAATFVNFIKLVNGGDGEENKTPVVHYKMLDQIESGNRNIANMCHRGLGKLGSPTSKILTPSGWTTMQDIQVGDHIISRYGVSERVDYKTPLQDPKMFKVTLCDGTTYEVGDEHNHIVWPYRKKEREKVMTTLQLLEKDLVRELSRTGTQDPSKTYTYSIPLCSPVQFTEKAYDIAPYTMGAGLSNGCFTKSHISTHAEDYREIRSYIEAEGHKFLSHRHTSTNGIQGKLVGHVFKQYTALRSHTKYIPAYYLLGSVAQRTELLRGLMDGDGHISINGSCSYDTVSKQLADDVIGLVQSLGGIASKTLYSGSYRVKVNIKINPFKLVRKASKWRPTKKTSRAIVSIEPIANTGGYCIHVDSKDHSYLTDGYTVTHNTAVLAEYLFLYLAVFSELPGFGHINFALYVSDSIDNGVKNMRKNLEHRYNNSAFLQKYVPKIKFTDVRWEFINADGAVFVVRGFGAKALSLDTKLFTVDGFTTIKDVKVGDRIFGADGELTTVTKKSEVFNKPMYKIALKDGRELKVSEDHINSIIHKERKGSGITYTRKNLYTRELLELPLQHVRVRSSKNKTTRISKEDLLFVENCRPLEYPEIELPIDPYTLGLLLGDGQLKRDGSCNLTAHRDDIQEYIPNIPYELGSLYTDLRNENVQNQSIKKLSQKVRDLGLAVHGNRKFVPDIYLRGSIEQRLELLKGLLDSDGSIQVNGRIDFSSNSERLIDGVINLVLSLGGAFSKRKMGKAFRTELWMPYVCFKLKRKRSRFKNKEKPMVAIVAIERIPDEPSQCIAVDNKDHQFIADSYFRTHNTGVRGAKELGTRPQLAVMDDLVSDEDARSATVITSIEDTIYKAVDYALSPTRRLTIWSGTPFNANDPLYKAVGSGAWAVNVYPVCEKFPCERHEFRGSWEDRFSYDYVSAQYEKAVLLGKVDTFNQELMLRIMSDEDRLIADHEIQWYSRDALMVAKGSLNFYITTDFATSEKKASDYSVISVWAVNYNGDYYWVDGICEQQTMDKNINDLFRLCHMYAPMEVGIEVSGQQGGFIPWIQKEMIYRKCFFNLASDRNSGSPGIRPTTDKMTRFNVVVPWFKSRKIYFPTEMRESAPMREMFSELTLVSKKGFKSKHDDFADTVSMLALLNIWLPSEDIPMYQDSSGIWEIEPIPQTSSLASYIF